MEKGKIMKVVKNNKGLNLSGNVPTQDSAIMFMLKVGAIKKVAKKNNLIAWSCPVRTDCCLTDSYLLCLLDEEKMNDLNVKKFT